MSQNGVMGHSRKLFSRKQDDFRRALENLKKMPISSRCCVLRDLTKFAPVLIQMVFSVPRWTIFRRCNILMLQWRLMSTKEEKSDERIRPFDNDKIRFSLNRDLCNRFQRVKLESCVSPDS